MKDPNRWFGGLLLVGVIRFAMLFGQSLDGQNELVNFLVSCLLTTFATVGAALMFNKKF